VCSTDQQFDIDRDIFDYGFTYDFGDLTVTLGENMISGEANKN
jgi:hypothetical protein